MFNLAALGDAVPDTSQDPSFTLDDRTIEMQLSFLKEYSQLIPFDEQHNWDEVFLSPVSAEQLAQLYRQPELADGTLAAQQALLLAFYRLLETPKALLNRLPAMHRQLYYRGLLGLKERGQTPDQVALHCQLEANTPELLLPAGLLMDAGQDSQGNPVQYALDKSLLANRGQWSDLRWCQPVESTHRVSRVLLDQQNKIAWPETGVRLFNSDTTDQAVVSGQVLGSELLAMSGGTRIITVTLAEAIADPANIKAYVSGDGQWLELQVGPGTGNQLTLTLSATAGAVTPPEGLDGFTSTRPLLKLSRLDGEPVPAITSLKVDVSGVTPVMYSTDDGVDKLTGRSYPFGHTPVIGSGFNLMAADWCNKPQTLNITLTPEWLDLPSESFKDWYTNYFASDNSFYTDTNKLFKVTSPYLNNVEGESSSSLFSGAAAPLTESINLTVTNLPAQITDSADPQDWLGWVRLELSGQDFLHQQYWQLLVSNPDLNPPYTPQLKSLAVSYTAEDSNIAEQYVLTPFGYGTPEQVNTQSDAYPQIYLGFSDIEPGQELTLHWQLQSPQPLTIAWQYLDKGNAWQPLDAQVLDDTGGLFDSGLWSVPLPEDAAQQAQMPLGRYWLRGVVTAPEQVGDSPISGYPRLLGLNTNSVTATLVNEQTLASTHFAQPLPAGTIRQPVQSISGLAQVEQPWPSQGGRAAESESAFLSRAARQLTHRGRALTWNDMVALLREHYPQIDYVHVPVSEGLSAVPARTTQQLIVIPVNGEQDNSDSLCPAFNPARLTAMKNYLQSLSSPWVDISVENPRYRNVEVRYRVDFIPGVNPDYAQRQLRQALERQYMPWGWDRQSSAAVGTQLDYYALVAFIQQLAFVERVEELTLNHDATSVYSQDGEVLILTWSTN